MPDKTCIGIDIGNDRLKIAVKKRGLVRKVITENVPDGAMSDNHIVSYDAMGDFIRDTMRRNHVSIKNAHLCMPIHEVYLRTVTMPMMNTQQLMVNLPYEFHDYITEDMDKYVYDYSVLPKTEEDEEEGEHLNLLAVAASKKLISSHMQMAKRAHIKLKSICPANVPLTKIFETALKERRLEMRDYAFLDLGDTSVKIHFFTNGKFEVTRSMDIGIGQAAQRISDETGSDIHISRMNFEANTGGVQREPYLEDVYANISSQVMRVLNFYNFNNRNNTLEDLYYYGGGSMITPFVDVLKEMVQLPLKSAAQLLPVKMKGSDEEKTIALQAIGMTL